MASRAARFSEQSAVSPTAWKSLGRSDLQASTCWDFPTQSPPGARYGDATFHGVTPAQCAMNLIRRYTAPGDLVVDPTSGSGTVADVASALGRRAVSFDLAPTHRGAFRADARAWPLRGGMAALALVDSPYSDNVAYSDARACLGRLSCRDPAFFQEMDRVAAEAHRVLGADGILAWIISDAYKAGLYTPVGFQLYRVLCERFVPVDTVVLVRHHDRSASPLWEHRARRFNFFLRGFKFLFVMRKGGGGS